jgi:RHS repeat-associated protein
MAIHDARGLTPITYTYNMLKAVVRQSSVDSGVQYMLADVAGQPLYAWDADGRVFHFTYDALRRQLTKQVTISGAVSTLEQLVYGETASSPQTYNLRGRLYKSYDGLGSKTIASYDFKGNPLQLQEQLLQDTTITDVNWSASPALSPEVFTTVNTYDALNRIITLTDPGNNITQNTYDEGGMLYAVKLTPTIGSVTQYITSITYDAKGQRQTIVYGNGTTTAYTYDPNIFRVTRLFTSKAGSNYQDLNYWYDPVGNITKVSDAAQRMLFFNNAVALPEQSYTYDALYRLVIATGREKIGPATFGVLDNYNDSPWMAGITWKADDNGCQNYTENYNYDEVGNIMTLQHSGAASGSSYTRIYNYDSASNKLLSTTVGTTTYSNAYDRRGNIVQMPHLSSITFNAANEMSSCNLGGGGNVYYQYSGGQRGRKTVINGSLTTQRIYIGNHEIYRSYTGSTLNVERRTVHVADDTGRIAMYEYRTAGSDSYAATLARYVYSNHLGTSTVELDPTGAIISYEEYHPYGTTAFQENNPAINAVGKRYRFTGKERDDESGFYYIGARYYAPWLGRWCACDPINSEIYNYNKGNPQKNVERHFLELTASNYEYCCANPIGSTDSSGEQAVDERIKISYQDKSVDEAATAAQMTVSLWDRAVDGFGNIMAVGFEWSITDKFEGSLIRTVLGKEGYTVPDIIDDKTLGESFSIRKVDREVKVVPDGGVGIDLWGVFVASLDVAAIASPSNGTVGFLAKTIPGEGAADVSLLLRSLKIFKRTEQLAKDIDEAKKALTSTFEAQGAAILEDEFGSLRRAKGPEAGDYVFTGGSLSGKSVDLLGVPLEAASKFKMSQFKNSIDAHFRKAVDFVGLDVRNVNKEQQKEILNYIHDNYSNQLNRLFIICKKM